MVPNVFQPLKIGCITVIQKFSWFYFQETSHMLSFLKIKSTRNVETTLSFTDKEKSCQGPYFVNVQICLLTLFAKIKFLQKFPNLQYCSCAD